MMCRAWYPSSSPCLRMAELPESADTWFSPNRGHFHWSSSHIRSAPVSPLHHGARPQGGLTFWSRSAGSQDCPIFLGGGIIFLSVRQSGSFLMSWNSLTSQPFPFYYQTHPMNFLFRILSFFSLKFPLCFLWFLCWSFQSFHLRVFPLPCGVILVTSVKFLLDNSSIWTVSGLTSSTPFPPEKWSHFPGSHMSSKFAAYLVHFKYYAMRI